jgi:hypothetical protein
MHVGGRNGPTWTVLVRLQQSGSLDDIVRQVHAVSEHVLTRVKNHSLVGQSLPDAIGQTKQSLQENSRHGDTWAIE